MTQFKGKYDFESQGPDELAFSAGEILTILDTTTPGGWWKAQNSAGQTGYIPADFVEAFESDSENIPEPSFAPPPLPPGESAPSATSAYDRNYTASATAAQSSSWFPASENYNTRSNEVQDTWSVRPPETQRVDNNNGSSVAPQTSGWDSDEFDEDDELSESQNSSSSSNVNRSVSQGNVADRHVISPNPSTTRSQSAATVISGPPSRPVPTRTVAPSGGVFMKLSDYAKTGVGAFILGQMKTVRPPPSESVQIMISDGLVQWRPLGSELGYDILPGHKVGGKLAGLKKFVEYTIAKRNSNAESVQRRYKQFDWLHEQLRNKFVILAIPPLPHKQITGRYEQDFIEERKRGLQAWLSRITRHPIVGYSAVFQHFVTCNEVKAWKQGKRTAEKDEWHGGRWLLSIEIPSNAAAINDREEVRQFEEYSESLYSAVRSMIETQQLYSKKQSCVYKRDYQKIGSSFSDLANAFQKSAMPGLQTLSRSTHQTAAIFEDISKLFGDQPDLDAMPFLDALYEYKGMLSDGLPEALGLSRSAAASLADVEKQGNEQKMLPEDVENCRSRQRVLNLALLAERTHLCRQQEADFEHMFCQFIRAQIAFYQNVTYKLQEALRIFPSSR